jgi:hypothetical protein
VSDRALFRQNVQRWVKASRENTAEFPGYNPESFEVLLNWVYTGKLSQLVAPEIEEEISTGAPACSRCTFEMYALAEKLRLTQLMDQAMDL